MNKRILSLCVLAIAGCGSESTSDAVPETPQTTPIPTPESPHMLPIDMGDPMGKLIDPIIEPIQKNQRIP